MIPEPSKRPFGYPLPADAIPHLVHPLSGHRFAKPFRDAHGNVVTWNGALAVRIRSFLPDLDLAEAPFEAVENSLRWFDPDAPEDKGKWRPLDDAAGLLWRYPPRSPWLRCRDGITGNTFTTVRVGAAAVVPLPLLQLAARLPRCRVYIDNQAAGPLHILWNGGEAVIRHIRGLPDPRFTVLKPRICPLRRDFIFTP